MSTSLRAEQILALEFEYARETATQAQTDRTVIVNLYLILVGGAGSLLLAAESIAPAVRVNIPAQALALLFFVLGVLGVLTLFKLVRLRQAWYGSVTAMNRIKDYYLEAFPELERALIWKTASIPPLGKAWSITFILSLMVIVLSSTAFAVALHFLEFWSGSTQVWLDAIAFVLIFGLQVLFYFYQLQNQDKLKPTKTELPAAS